MIRCWLVLLLSLGVLLLELPLAANKEECFKHIRQRDTFDKARRICDMQEQALVNAYSLEKYITQNQFDMLEGTYWLPLEKKTLQEWHTLSNTPYGKPIVDEHYQVRGQDCAMIHTLDEMVDSTYCHVKLEGHICSNIDVSMVVNRWAKDEPALEKSCAVLHTKSLTWKAVNCDEEHNYVCSSTSDGYERSCTCIWREAWRQITGPVIIGCSITGLVLHLASLICLILVRRQITQQSLSCDSEGSKRLLQNACRKLV